MTDIPMNIKIAKYFTLAEMCASDTAKEKDIKNQPTVTEVVNLTLLCTKVLDPLRKAMGPITISSGFRCAALNKAVGGVRNSQHMKGQAADIYIKGNLAYGKKIFAWIKEFCEFDQLIWEHNEAGAYWVHVSYNLDGNRKKVIDNLLKK